VEKKLKLVFDIHIFSKYCDDSEAKEKLDALENDGITYIGGDTVDMSCMPKDMVEAGLRYQLELLQKWNKGSYHIRNGFIYCSYQPDKIFYIPGNHCHLPVSRGFRDFAIHVFPDGTKCLIAHGHRVGNKKRKAKWDKYSEEKHGAGKLKLMWVDFADDMDWIKGLRPVPEDTIADAFYLAKRFGCQYVAIGHLHPNRLVQFEQDGITLKCCPKGFNEVIF